MNANGRYKPQPIQNYRCMGQDCSRLLFRAIMAHGVRIEIRCPKCNRVSVFRFDARTITQELAQLDTFPENV